MIGTVQTAPRNFWHKLIRLKYSQCAFPDVPESVHYGKLHVVR